jgi:hypothetical protein
MAMANAAEKETQHGLLVVWGRFAQEIGLISGINAVKLAQKTYDHSPQAKALEFLVAILSGAKHLQDISLAAHPLDKDLVLARAWGQTVWIAHHSEPEPDQLAISKMGIKRQVQVAAHASAQVIQNADGMLLRFSSASSLAGKSLHFRAVDRPVHPTLFLPLFTILDLIVQKLR